MVERLFLAVPWGCLRFVIVVFPDHTHLLFFIDLIEKTFQREGSPYLACNERNAFLLRKNLKNIMHGHVKMYVMR